MVFKFVGNNTNKMDILIFANKDFGQRSVSLLYMKEGPSFKEGSNGFYVDYFVTCLERIRFIPST